MWYSFAPTNVRQVSFATNLSIRNSIIAMAADMEVVLTADVQHWPDVLQISFNHTVGSKYLLNKKYLPLLVLSTDRLNMREWISSSTSTALPQARALPLRTWAPWPKRTPRLLSPTTTSSQRLFFVEYTQESSGEQQILDDFDYDDVTIGQMLFNAYRGQVDHSEREGLSSCLSLSSMSHDRAGKPVVRRDTSHAQVHEIQRQNSESEQIGTLLERQREQILADCLAEIRKHRIPG